MAVLIEATSVVIRADALLEAFEGDWEAFKAIVPNDTLCADTELVRIGFMMPQDVKAFVGELATFGLVYLDRGVARDLVVVDQQRGPMVRCDWIEFGHVDVNRDPAKRVAACRLKGSPRMVIETPVGWTFEGSLSQTFSFVPTEYLDRAVTFLRHEDGLDVYWDSLAGREVFVARTSSKEEL